MGASKVLTVQQLYYVLLPMLSDVRTWISRSPLILACTQAAKQCERTAHRRHVSNLFPSPATFRFRCCGKGAPRQAARILAQQQSANSSLPVNSDKTHFTCQVQFIFSRHLCTYVYQSMHVWPGIVMQVLLIIQNIRIYMH